MVMDDGSQNSEMELEELVRTSSVVKALKKMMTIKYCPRGEIKKLEIELWNLKVKGTDVASYTLHFQELALMCGRMFHEESEEVEILLLGTFLIMIRGNVIVISTPRRWRKQLSFHQNDQMRPKSPQLLLKGKLSQKWKLEFNA
ncbi:hypothetical protein Tco_0894044 [Tanacetum coccineum]|uniref:Reverse transcriptase domain-containing protein n=1 Tax=Tanacetum coccineum TaxID=301880 RepID=A0ABQ5CDF4_9ASTR